MTTQRVAQGNEAMAVERWETESICSSCCWLTITASCQRPRQTEVLVFIKSGIQMKALFGQSPARWISFRFWRLQRFKNRSEESLRSEDLIYKCAQTKSVSPFCTNLRLLHIQTKVDLCDLWPAGCSRLSVFLSSCKASGCFLLSSVSLNIREKD